MIECPLCQCKKVIAFHQDKLRVYFRCKQCLLVFVDPQSLPTQQQELAEYQLHQNTLTDSGYLSFLNRLVECVLPHLTLPAPSILDYGSGPCHALAHLFAQHGYHTDCYDPLFGPFEIPAEHYDVITATESIEHFHRPAREWQRWMTLLQSGGWLAIMTKRVLSADKFAQWHYKNDPTHVCFFSVETFTWLARKHGLNVIFPQRDIVLMQKPKQ
ncbi:class I SAM-dependent methyltransferase [Alteromonas gilva]|uniref:Class I SAM-dependent methyltransferase n=1 Tax=Alteromonas gilva TaxID=2987522 RepID=A0ABT5L015_9ALTE|nr:class I SAM-dependent methyltransferase [Alteromonas gilva]MDC8829148.1 class I SAM-dependent methyltransferase [Alteromonas gilva]